MILVSILIIHLHFFSFNIGQVWSGVETKQQAFFFWKIEPKLFLSWKQLKQKVTHILF